MVAIPCCICDGLLDEADAVDITAEPWRFWTTPGASVLAHRQCADECAAECDEMQRDDERDYWNAIKGGFER